LLLFADFYQIFFYLHCSLVGVGGLKMLSIRLAQFEHKFVCVDATFWDLRAEIKGHTASEVNITAYSTVPLRQNARALFLVGFLPSLSGGEGRG
jgi:hypothetical protein